MSDERDKKLELIKKLKALAERGVGGEKEGAQKKLDELIKKYNVDIEEIDNEEIKIERHPFYYKGKYEKQILIQVIAKVTNSESKIYTGLTSCNRRSRNRLVVECTKIQSLEIQITYEFYISAWYEELELFNIAFINKHNLFGRVAESEEDSYESQYTKEQLFRMSMMANSMQNKSMHKYLSPIGIEGE